MNISLKTVPYENILPLWESKLWIGRSDPIRNMSSMLFMGGYDMNIYQKYTPTFWAIYINNVIIGVNSGFKTSDMDYRSRGVWVDVNYRGLGLSSLLFNIAVIQAKIEKCDKIWSLPRKSALPSYEAVGFKKCSEWIDEGVEFGPNCYVLKEL